MIDVGFDDKINKLRTNIKNSAKSENKNYLFSDFKMLIGLIEPHPIAGYSGGRKSVCPGLIDSNSFKIIHSKKITFSKYSIVGNLENNMLHLIATKVAQKVGTDFIINISINKNKEITNFFCGSLIEAFEEGVNFVSRTSKIKSNSKYDLIITHGGGRGLDNTYASLGKAINIANNYVKKGGVIIVFGECYKGIGPTRFKELTLKGNSLKEIIQYIELKKEFIFEQWNIHFLYKVFKKSKVYLFSNVYKKHPEVGKFTPQLLDVNQFINSLKNKNANLRIGVIEDGPFSI